MIHVYCFVSTKGVTNDGDEDAAAARTQICSQIAGHLRCDEFGRGASMNEEQLVITDVRGVAPRKSMFCASFRLPAEVAFCRDVEK